MPLFTFSFSRMEDNEKSSAMRTYCVWADHVLRVFQEVEAESPEKAHELAWDRPEHWQHCLEHEANEYRLSDDVQDVETQAYFTVVDVEHCKTCRSEIVETVNGTNFREGECGPCELLRYQSQADLLAAAYMALEEIEQWDEVMGGSEDPRTHEAIAALKQSIAKAHGKQA